MGDALYVFLHRALKGGLKDTIWRVEVRGFYIILISAGLIPK
jgi:hypothetical protein